MLKRAIHGLITLLFLGGVAFAQTPVYQNGAVTPGDPAVWSAQRYIADGSTGTGLTNIVITNSLPAFNYYDAATSGQYHLLQIGANSTSNAALISYGAFGGASTQPLLFSINGGTIQMNQNALTLGASGAAQGSVVICGSTSGCATLRTATAAGTPTIYLPTTVAAAGNPMISGGASAPWTYGTISGNTTEFVTGTGSFTLNNIAGFDASGNLKNLATLSGTTTNVLTLSGSNPANGNCLKGDGNGNAVDGGGPCGSAGVGSGTAGQIPWYATTGTAIVGSPNLNLVVGGGLSTFTVGQAGTNTGALALPGSTAGTATLQASANFTSWSIVLPTTGGPTGCLQTQGTGSTALWAGCLNWVDTAKTTSFNAVAYSAYCIDTLSVGALTATLPTTPAGGTMEQFIDCQNNFGNAALTIAPGGSDKIMKQAQNMTVGTSYVSVVLRYDAALANWSLQ